MTGLDRVGNRDNFYCMGFAGKAKKRWNVCTVMVLLYIYSKISGVRLPIKRVIKITF